MDMVLLYEPCTYIFQLNSPLSKQCSNDTHTFTYSQLVFQCSFNASDHEFQYKKTTCYKHTPTSIDLLYTLKLLFELYICTCTAHVQHHRDASFMSK